MGVITTYDDMREELRDMLNDCLKKAREMFDEDIWGYSDMKDDYIDDVYLAIKRARDTV